MPDWRYAIERRLEGLRLPPARESEVVEELSQHLDDRYEELRADGVDDETARREAIADLDAADLVGELTGVEQEHVEPIALGGGLPSLAGGLWTDIRYGARILRKDAGASLAIVFTLALAIAANAIVYGFVDLLLLRPLPIRNTPRLVTIFGSDRRQASDRQPISAADYLDLKAQMTTLEDASAVTTGQLSLTTGEPAAVRAYFVTPNVFRVWDLAPASGRLFLPGEDVPGKDHVVALAYRFWTTRFAGDPAIVGRTLTLNGAAYTVVGVVTPAIEVGNLADIDVWLPLAAGAGTRRDDRTLLAMGLLKPGATLDAVQAELATVSDRLQRAYPGTNAGITMRAVSFRDSTVGRSTWIILALLGIVVGLVLLVACANVATVMLARASARRREIALRLALGATRGRLVRQLVSEGLIVGFASGAIGLALAYGGLMVFKSLSMDAYFQQLAVNVNLLAFAFVLSALTPVLFGVLPALQSSKPDLNEDLKDGGRDASSSARGNRSRAVLLVAQVAVALAVVIVAGLVVRTARSVQRAPLGMNPDGLLAMRVRLDPPNYTDDDARQRKVDAILERLTSLGGVTSAAATAGFVIEGEPVRQFAIDGRPQATPGDAPWANEAAITADYWTACEIPLLEGRTWQASDRAAGWNVAIVNREAVRRYWPSRSPIGQRITMLDAKGQPSGAPLEIVGVAGNVIGSEPTDPAPPRLYRPLATRPFESVGFLVRGAADVTGLVTPVREALRSEDRDLAVSGVRPARTQLDAYLRSWDLILSLFAGFAAIGFVVALTGVYGVTAFSVGQRRHEIGVRLALGATPPQLLRLIAARTFRLIALGVVFGVAGGWAIGRAMRGILYGVAATDPATYLVGLLLIALCGIVATLVPAMRVMSIEPMLVLKRD